MTSTTSAIIISTPDQGQTVALIPHNAGKDAKSRLTAFVQWQADSGLNWTQPNLADYSRYLQSDQRRDKDGRPLPALSPASTNAHLSTIRGRYKAILADNATRRALYQHAAAAGAVNPADSKAMVDEMLTQINNAIVDRSAAAKVIKHQDIADDKHVRLSIKQASDLIAAPGTSTLVGLRDTALIALALATGLREMELCALDVDDLRKTQEGVLCLSVKEGKGSKSRLVPYGAMVWCLTFVDTWLAAAGITSGAVFRGFRKNNKTVLPGRLTTRTVQNILKKYPIKTGRGQIVVNPHDLRRTYARRVYDDGLPIEKLQENLGHADVKTTRGYIGEFNAMERQPGNVYGIDMRDYGDLAAWGSASA